MIAMMIHPKVQFKLILIILPNIFQSLSLETNLAQKK